MPVLLDECIAGLRIIRDGTYIDGTFGRGGHSRAILQELGSLGRLVAIDRDPQAISEADAALLGDPRFELVRGEIAALKTYASDRQMLGKVDGLLLDLGVSSPQLDEAGRGFSFRADGPLDMRMDPSTGKSAADWLADVDEKELKYVLRTLGEERNAARIARAIVDARDVAPLKRTGQLAEVIAAVAPRAGRKRHPATKSFQAIRMLINDELGQLNAALRATLDILRPGGRLCVISFHSLEDRSVKRFIRQASQEAPQYRGLPDVPEEFRPQMRPVGRAVSASDNDVALNPRARSARLRIAEKL